MANQKVQINAMAWPWVVANERAHGIAWSMWWPIRRALGNAMAWPWACPRKAPMEEDGPLGLPFRKHQAKPWHGHVCGRGNASPMEEPGPWDGHSESTRQSHGMAIGGAKTRPMEELGPCDGQSESTKDCHGMGKGNEQLHGRAWAMGWPTRKSRTMPWHSHGYGFRHRR